jgi:hypothetical protein
VSDLEAVVVFGEASITIPQMLLLDTAVEVGRGAYGLVIFTGRDAGGFYR